MSPACSSSQNGLWETGRVLFSTSDAREATRDELLLKHRAEHVDQILGLKDLAPEVGRGCR